MACHYPNSLYENATWPKTILPALSLTLGLQIMRTLWPYLRYATYKRLDIGPWLTILVVLTVFVAVFSTTWFYRWLGLRRLLVLSAGGLGLARLVMQVWSGDPLGDLLAATIGMACFSLFLPTYLVVVRTTQTKSAETAARFASGLLLGLAVDTALHGVFLTYDFIWQAGLVPLLLAMILVVAQGATLYRLLPSLPLTARDGTWSSIGPWVAIGPFLALQMLVFQNLGRFASVTDWPLPPVFTWILLGQVISLWFAWRWQPRGLLEIGGIGIILIGSLSFIQTTHPVTQALLLGCAQAASAVLITTIVRCMAENGSEPGLKYTGLVHGLGMTLMILLIGFTYVDDVLPSRMLPSSPVWLFDLAGMLIVLSAAKAIGLATTHPRPVASWSAPLVALPLLLLPAFVWFTWRDPIAIHPESETIRVITYNIHNGFNTKGHLDLEAQVQVWATQQADVIALQEVSRGEVINGSVDMLSWLSQRLGLPYAYTSVGDAWWGQATFSRYPILKAESHPLAPANLPIRRSFTYLEIETGRPQPLKLINTHYHASLGRQPSGPIRLAHTQTILDFMADRATGQVVLTGDLNAGPDRPEMQAFFATGLVDVIDQAGITPGYTAHSESLGVRIDYILISPHLTSDKVVIPFSTASDHLSVAATLKARSERF